MDRDRGFIVMYTKRLTQKNKKWQDGTLSFKAANKKAQVRNEDGKVIDECFLRQGVHFDEEDNIRIGSLLVQKLEEQDVLPPSCSSEKANKGGADSITLGSQNTATEKWKKPTSVKRQRVRSQFKRKKRRGFVPPAKVRPGVKEEDHRLQSTSSSSSSSTFDRPGSDANPPWRTKLGVKEETGLRSRSLGRGSFSEAINLSLSPKTKVRNPRRIGNFKASRSPAKMNEDDDDDAFESPLALSPNVRFSSCAADGRFSDNYLSGSGNDVEDDFEQDAAFTALFGSTTGSGSKERKSCRVVKKSHCGDVVLSAMEKKTASRPSEHDLIDLSHSSSSMATFSSMSNIYAAESSSQKLAKSSGLRYPSLSKAKKQHLKMGRTQQVKKRKANVSLVRTTASTKFSRLQFRGGGKDGAQERQVQISSSFKSIQQYRKVFTEALYEEAQARITEQAKKYFSFASQKNVAVDERMWRRRGIAFYSNVNYTTNRNWRKKKGDENLPKKPRFFIQISGKQRERYTKYSLHDVWILSLSKAFSSSNTRIVYSLWHGPSSKDNKMEVKPMGSQGLWPSQHESLYAIRGDNAADILEMLKCLESLSPRDVPVINAFCRGSRDSSAATQSASSNITSYASNRRKLHSQRAGCASGQGDKNPLAALRVSEEVLSESVREVCTTHQMNSDQKKVMEVCTSWLGGSLIEGSVNNRICLVHGPFGSGKSTVIVRTIIVLSSILDKYDPEKEVRILVGGKTNVAVDRILEGLLKNGFSDFGRVGSQKKISAPILEYAYPFNDKNETIQTRHCVKELKGRLNTASADSVERVHVKRAITSLESNEKNAESLSRCRVVGATTRSSTFPILANQKFSIVCLDECSQMIEPMSLLCIQYGCEALLACGDPKQLPPVLSPHFSNSNSTINSFPSSFSSLGDGLFARLSTVSTPILLRNQYRCHPKISTLANELFYSNQLRDGITEHERLPVVSALPPVVVCDLHTSSPEAKQNSFVNDKEAFAVDAIVGALASKGVPLSQIGVISLYKAQVQLLKDKLSGVLARAASAKKPLDEEERDIFEDQIWKKLEGETNGNNRDGSSQEKLEVSTVDAFQGAEKDIVILNTVRPVGKNNEFTDNPNRINVAITRARRHLIIVGRFFVGKLTRKWELILQAARNSHSLWKTVRDIVKRINKSDREPVIRYPQQLNTPFEEKSNAVAESDQYREQKEDVEEEKEDDQNSFDDFEDIIVSSISRGGHPESAYQNISSSCRKSGRHPKSINSSCLDDAIKLHSDDSEDEDKGRSVENGPNSNNIMRFDDRDIEMIGFKIRTEKEEEEEEEESDTQLEEFKARYQADASEKSRQLNKKDDEKECEIVISDDSDFDSDLDDFNASNKKKYDPVPISTCISIQKGEERIVEEETKQSSTNEEKDKNARLFPVVQKQVPGKILSFSSLKAVEPSQSHELSFDDGDLLMHSNNASPAKGNVELNKANVTNRFPNEIDLTQDDQEDQQSNHWIGRPIFNHRKGKDVLMIPVDKEYPIGDRLMIGKTNYRIIESMLQHNLDRTPQAYGITVSPPLKNHVFTGDEVKIFFDQG